jgi:N-[(2S)-2-amino-2-carboxyethyl]-L-glutamate dehydrogenase
MLYLNSDHLNEIGINWNSLIKVIEDSIDCLRGSDYAQPIKPYLRFHDIKNRIIAMPAFVGGQISMAGIKWIASYPDNIHKKIARAHSVTILNSCESGKPLCTINSTQVSCIRTAAVSGYVLQQFLQNKKNKKLNIGIIGFGPIGKIHLNLVLALLNEQINNIYLFDINGLDADILKRQFDSRVFVKDSWESCYLESDVFITCTVSNYRYINIAPKKGSLQLNVSLRDYDPCVRKFMDVIIVDDWEEVCRQNTDIENMAKYEGLTKEEVHSITEIKSKSLFSSLRTEDIVMFNPMGMAVFDISIGAYYYQMARNLSIGIDLED